MGSSYEEHFINIVKHGRYAAPRGMPVSELQDQQLMVPAGTIVRRKKLNPKIGYMEMLQLIAGFFDKDLIGRAAPKAQLDLFSGQSAYGPRTTFHIPRIIEALEKDGFTRQAVLFIGEPHEGGQSVLPCAYAVQFQLRDDRLDATVTMRSSDTVFGLPYDIMQFGGLTQAIAYVLDALSGVLTFNLANAHIYHKTSNLKPIRGYDRFYLPVFNRWADYKDWAYGLAHDWNPKKDAVPPSIRLQKGLA